MSKLRLSFGSKSEHERLFTTEEDGLIIFANHTSTALYGYANLGDLMRRYVSIDTRTRELRFTVWRSSNTVLLNDVMPSSADRRNCIFIDEHEYQMTELRNLWQHGTFARYYVRLVTMY